MPWSHRAQPELQCWDSSGYKRDRKPKPDQFSPSPKIWSNDTTLSGSSLKGLSGEPRKLAKDREPGSLSSLMGVCCRIISIHTLLPCYQICSLPLSVSNCQGRAGKGIRGDIGFVSLWACIQGGIWVPWKESGAVNSKRG